MDLTIIHQEPKAHIALHWWDSYILMHMRSLSLQFYILLSIAEWTECNFSSEWNRLELVNVILAGTLKLVYFYT